MDYNLLLLALLAGLSLLVVLSPEEETTGKKITSALLLVALFCWLLSLFVPVRDAVSGCAIFLLRLPLSLSALALFAEVLYSGSSVPQPVLAATTGFVLFLEILTRATVRRGLSPFLLALLASSVLLFLLFSGPTLFLGLLLALSSLCWAFLLLVSLYSSSLPVVFLVLARFPLLLACGVFLAETSLRQKGEGTFGSQVVLAAGTTLAVLCETGIFLLSPPSSPVDLGFSPLASSLF